jgi:hypothetical protein
MQFALKNIIFVCCVQMFLDLTRKKWQELLYYYYYYYYYYYNCELVFTRWQWYYNKTTHK